MLSALKQWWLLRPLRAGLRDLETRINVIQDADHVNERAIIYRAIQTSAELLADGVLWSPDSGKNFVRLLRLPIRDWNDAMRAEAALLAEKINQVHQQHVVGGTDELISFGLWFWSTNFFAMTSLELQPDGKRIWEKICSSASSAYKTELENARGRLGGGSR